MKVVSYFARIWILLVVVVLFTALMSASLPLHAAGSAQLRVTQLTYRTIKEGKTYDMEADIYVDGTLAKAWTAVAFPYDTDYMSLPEGKHLVTVVMTGESPDKGQPVDMNLTADHHYNLVAYGDFAAKPLAVKLLSVDETSLLADNKIAKDAGTLIVVNLIESSAALEISLDGKLAAKVPSAGNTAALILPSAKFKLRAVSPDVPDKPVYDDDWVGLPSTVVTIVAWGKLPDKVSTMFARHSDLKIGDWLAAVGAIKGTDFSSDYSNAAQAIKMAGLQDDLTGDGPFTVFAPQDGAQLPPGIATPDAAGSPNPQWLALVKNHIVPGRFAPNDLRHQKTLKTLQGSDLTLDLGKTKSGMWEIDGIPIWWDVRLANGVVYIIDGVLVPKS